MAIRAQDDLAVVRFELLDRVEKLLLNDSFAVEEIDVVDDEHVDAAEPLAKAGKGPIPQRLREMVGEPLRRKEQDTQCGMAGSQPTVRRLQQMRLSRADSAVKHERIVTASRLLADLQGGRQGQFVAGSLHKVGQVGETATRLLRRAGLLEADGAECGVGRPASGMEH